MQISPSGDAIRQVASVTADHLTFQKVAWHIIPFLFLCYVVSFLDRVNIGFAQLQMKHDLGFSDAMYGLGAAVCLLNVRDIHERRGGLHLPIHGKGNKLRYVPLHPASAERIHAYLELAGQGTTSDAPLFQPVRRTGASITAYGLHKCVLAHTKHAKIGVDGFGVHSLGACACTASRERSGQSAALDAAPRGCSSQLQAAPQLSPDVQDTARADVSRLDR